MFKLKFAVMLSACLITLISSAQKRKCGAYENYIQQLKSDPLFAKNQAEMEAFTKRFIENGGSKAVMLTQRSSVIYTIPVVVHVVYKTSTENISYTQVKSQVNALNNDYQLMNNDASLVPSAFSSVVANCKIKFCLAQTDPYGNATSGVVRTKTTTASFTQNDDVKFSSRGGDDAWPADKYLNIWVCNLGNGLLGYAQFPGGTPETDGVVVLFSAFGTTGAALPPFDKGRTATHEIGHWLNLFHIWGDDGSACTGSDYVDDTPNQASENYGCPSFPNISCSNGPNGDMFMNYMDYSNDACMYMFTNGQRDRMYAVLQAGGLRRSVTQSGMCSKPASTTCIAPSNLKASSVKTSSAKLTWNKVAGAQSYTLQYKKASNNSYTVISGLTDTTYKLTNLSQNSIYQYQLQSHCSGGDVSNLTYPAKFTTKEIVLACTDNYEPNNSLSASKSIPVNTNITGIISSVSDIDFYSFNNTSASPNVKITLRNLPADYDMVLYNPSGKIISYAENSGTEDETLIYNLTKVGVYKIKVYGYNKANDPQKCYLLNVAISTEKFRISDKATETTADVMLYPQPAQNFATVEFSKNWKGKATINVFDETGRMITTQTANTESRTYKLNTSSLSNGLYYVRITNGSETISKKMIIQK